MVAAANNQEVEAGFRIPPGRQCIDAGVAATLAAAVTEQARFGLGGEMPLIIKPWQATSGSVRRWRPKKATADFYLARSRTVGGPGVSHPFPPQGC
jgi:gamma-glutamyltranspeptidase